MTTPGAGDRAEDRRRQIAGIRHDLRTPINHVIGYSEMLQEMAEDDGQDLSLR